MIIPLVNQPIDFCMQAYSKYKIEDTDIKTILLERPRLVFARVEEQLEAIFLPTPCEIKHHIFSFIDTNELFGHRLVCRTFYSMIVPVWASRYLPNFSDDFLSLEEHTDIELADMEKPKMVLFGEKEIYFTPKHYNFENEKKDLQILTEVTSKISKFKTHCIFLINNINQGEKKIKKVSRRLKSTLSIQASCQDFLDRKLKVFDRQKTLDSQPSLEDNIVQTRLPGNKVIVIKKN